MIDHIGIKVADFDRAKAFYDEALAPLGARLLMMVPVEYTGGVKVGGYGRDRPVCWLHEEGGTGEPKHIAFAAATRAEVDAFHRAALAAGGRDNGARVSGRIITPTITARSCSIPTATMSKPSAMPRHERQRRRRR